MAASIGKAILIAVVSTVASEIVKWAKENA